MICSSTSQYFDWLVWKGQDTSYFFRNSKFVRIHICITTCKFWSQYWGRYTEELVQIGRWQSRKWVTSKLKQRQELDTGQAIAKHSRDKKDCMKQQMKSNEMCIYSTTLHHSLLSLVSKTLKQIVSCHKKQFDDMKNLWYYTGGKNKH